MEESKNGSEIEQDVSWRSVGRTLYYPTMEIAALMDPSLQAWGQLIAEFQREPSDSSVRQNYEALKWCFGHVRRGRAGEAAGLFLSPGDNLKSAALALRPPESERGIEGRCLLTTNPVLRVLVERMGGHAMGPDPSTLDQGTREQVNRAERTLERLQKEPDWQDIEERIARA